jgi:hypothetical protein
MLDLGGVDLKERLNLGKRKINPLRIKLVNIIFKRTLDDGLIHLPDLNMVGKHFLHGIAHIGELKLMGRGMKTRKNKNEK